MQRQERYHNISSLALIIEDIQKRSRAICQEAHEARQRSQQQRQTSQEA